MRSIGITKPIMERIPLYLQYLRGGGAEKKTVSATAIAHALGLGEVLVRKDLGAISGAGRPKIGYVTEELVAHLERYMRMHTENTAILLGAGQLGRALLGYTGFSEYALRIVAAFDADPTVCCGDILPLTEFPDFCTREHPQIGILAVPEEAADDACRLLTDNGIRAIWNFSRRRLHPPAGVLVRNEDLASSLAALSGQLNQRSQM